MSTNLNRKSCGNANNQWTVKMVEEYFKEAALTLKRLPPAEWPGYFYASRDMIYSQNELLFQEKKPMRILATPEAISRLDKIFDWIIWLEIEERKLIWRRATNVRWNSICSEFGYNRITAWRKWNFALEKVAKRLNNAYK